MQSCEHLYSLAPTLITLTCISNVDNLTGHAAKSYQELKQGLEQENDTSPSIQIWVLTLLAEMAERLGDIAAQTQIKEVILEIV